MAATGHPTEPPSPDDAAGSAVGSATRWRRVKAVFAAALDASSEPRAAFLADQCAGDDDLRREVESLLACDAAAGSFCERPAAALLESCVAPRPADRRLAAGSRLGAFEITGFLGAGGMGEVYLARDTQLGREVAIKTVSATLTDAAAHAGLMREAQHASRLCHPHICTIHEVGESEGLPFIVMEFIEGQALHDRLRDAPLPLGAALTLGTQIAATIEHAHSRGIVHRDLKSSNVMITPDRGAVVLDFGLAKRLPEADVRRTDTNAAGFASLAGTLTHMAPEVLLGRQADVPSDVWALGVLLYEMVTGSLPFAGETPFEMSSAIITGAPAPLPRSIPRSVRLVIQRCLAKDPGERYQRAAEVADALEGVRARDVWPPATTWLPRRRLRQAAAVVVLAGAATWLGADHLGRLLVAPRPAAVTTVAVLPFDSAGTADDPSYAVGMTQALTAELGTLDGIRVIARTSTARLHDMGKTPQEIAGEVGANLVVTGRLRRESDRITMDARLIEAASGRVLWSDTLERGIRDVLVLQADVVTALADRLEVVLRPEVRDRLTVVRAVDPAVYEAYLKGRYYWTSRTRASLQTALEHFTRAIELDPSYATAHAALADCYNQLGTVMVGTGSPITYRPKAAAAAMKALQLDPALAEAHATLGYVKHYEWEWDEAERHLKRAIELNPSYALARIWYANLLSSRLRLDEALAQVHAARDLDPFSPVVNTNVGWVLLFARRYEAAADQLVHTLEIDPTYVQAHQRLASALAALGRLDEALVHARRAVELSGGSPTIVANLVGLHARMARRGEAEAVLRQVLEASQREYVPAWAIASMYAGLADFDTALTWMERAYAERSNGIAYLAVEEHDGRLRRHPRFLALLGRAGLDDVVVAAQPLPSGSPR